MSVCFLPFANIFKAAVIMQRRDYTVYPSFEEAMAIFGMIGKYEVTSVIAESFRSIRIEQ